MQCYCKSTPYKQWLILDLNIITVTGMIISPARGFLLMCYVFLVFFYIEKSKLVVEER